MTTAIQQLIDALRDELQQYGEMLALLEAQWDVVTQREPQSVLTSVADVESQSGAIEKARRTREQAQRQFAWALGQPVESHSFHQLLPLLPGDYRPLVTALVHEVNELLQRVRERAAQNHAQLRRALELMERFISSISPQTQSALIVGEQSPFDSESTPPRSATA
jgi:hypothetical protein